MTNSGKTVTERYVNLIMAASTDDARLKLIRVLQHAHSGETAAINAYEGHWRSLKIPEEIESLKRIQQDEVEHKEIVYKMLTQLDASPNANRDKVFYLIGRIISALCRIGGWYIPMYGAGRLEKPNTREYEDAARYAHQSGHHELVDELLKLAEVEWDHEKYLREQAASHWLSKLIPVWTPPEPRERIRESFEEFSRVNGVKSD